MRGVLEPQTFGLEDRNAQGYIRSLVTYMVLMIWIFGSLLAALAGVPWFIVLAASTVYLPWALSIPEKIVSRVSLTMDDRQLEIKNIRGESVIPWNRVASIDVQGHPWGSKWSSSVVVVRTDPHNIWIETRLDATFIGKRRFSKGSAGARVIAEANARRIKLEPHVLDRLDDEARSESEPAS